MNYSPQTRRRWADIAVIVAGLALFGLAILFPRPMYAIAGGLTLIGFLLGQRWEWRSYARGLLLIAVAGLVFGLFTWFSELGLVAWLTVIIPGVLLLVAIPYFGPMPRAAEERRTVR